MTVTIDAVYDGRAFLPTEPVALAPNTRVRIAIVANQDEPESFLSVAQSLGLDGPPDWSSSVDEYLYGGKHTDGA